MRFLFGVALCGIVSTLYASDPVLGKWKLNLEKSTYLPGPAPKNQTRAYEAIADGIKVTIRTVGEDGKTIVVEHPVNYDGKEQPVTGSVQSDAIQLQKIDDCTSESVMKHAGKVIGRNRRVVAEDGRSMTITYEGLDSRGRQVKVTASTTASSGGRRVVRQRKTGSQTRSYGESVAIDSTSLRSWARCGPEGSGSVHLQSAPGRSSSGFWRVSPAPRRGSASANSRRSLPHKIGYSFGDNLRRLGRISQLTH